jgi:quercetin dioxygenase-like cupin family protein/ketosteroid isomerase-like protein
MRLMKSLANDVEDFRSTMLARQAEAEEAFANGDPEPRMKLWSRRDPVTLFGAAGMSESGWDQLSETFPWVASRLSNVSDYRFDVEVVEVSGDMAYTLGFERFNGSIAGRPVEPITVRVTHIYRREDGEWKIVHRHGDNPAVDPRDGREVPRPLLRRPGEAQTADNALGGAVTYWARSEETGGSISALETAVAPGAGPPLHVHVNEDEFIYVLEGRVRVRLEDDVHDAPAGSFVFIPKGMPHTWQNVRDDVARFLFGFAPGAPGMEGFFEHGAAAGAGLDERFARFARDAGMRVVGPPL